MTESRIKVFQVLDEEGLQILLDALARKIKDNYVSKDELNNKFTEFMENDLPELYSFHIDENGHLIVTYKTPEELENERNNN